MQFHTSFRIQIEVIIIYLKNKLLKVLFITYLFVYCSILIKTKTENEKLKNKD